MRTIEQDKKEYSDEELEEIMGMQGHEDLLSTSSLRKTIRDNPLLVTGLTFAFGLLVGASLLSARRKSR